MHASEQSRSSGLSTFPYLKFVCASIGRFRMCRPGRSHVPGVLLLVGLTSATVTGLSLAAEFGAFVPFAEASDGRALVDAGWDEIRRGNYGAAVRIFEMAMATVPRNATLFLGLGVARFHLDEWPAATADLHRALELDSGLELVHMMLAAMAFSQDELETAIRHYEAASRLDPNDVGVQEQLFLVRRAQQAEGHLARLSGDHFLVKYEASHEDVAARAMAGLEKLYDLIGSRLGYFPPQRIIVVLYSDARFQPLTEGPEWAGGFYDGRIHLAARLLMQASVDTDGALAHEYVHAVVHRLAAGRAPTWLDEGLALLFEGRAPSWSDELLARREAELIPLHALHGPFLQLSAAEARIAYAESHSATQMLVDRYGFTRVSRLLAALAGGQEFTAAFQRILQVPYHEFETDWTVIRRGRKL